MKMTNKFVMAGAAVLILAASIFTGCKMDDGEGSTTGTKWNTTMTVDGTGISTKYRRYWKQIGTKEECYSFTTTINIDLSENTTSSDSRKSVAGLLFDLNENADDKDKVDFCILGVQVETGKYYLERYTGVPKNAEGGLDTDESALGAANTDSLDGKGSSENFVTVPAANMEKYYTLTKENGSPTNIKAVVTVTQTTDGTYSVKLGDKVIGTYTDNRTTNKNGTKIAGGLAVYGNAPKGCKIVANYKTDKDTLGGALFAEPVEE